MVISDDNRIVNGLWIGESLSSLEMLTIRSFINHGHTFRLWVYDQLTTPLPPGVLVMDANIILPAERIFRYKHKNQYGHGKGSLAGFSDIFRYKLLFDHGGWWVDMDVTCLKTLEFKAQYVFRSHHELKMVGNIMKCPKGSELMKRCFDLASEKVTADNRDWNLPIQILNDQIKYLDLERNIIEISNEDSWLVIKRFILKDFEIPDNWYVIHWVNEEWNRNGINKNYAARSSLLNRLKTENGMPPPKIGLKEIITTRMKLTTFSVASRYITSGNSFALAYYLITRMIKSTLYKIYFVVRRIILWGWGYVDYYIQKYLKRTDGIEKEEKIKGDLTSRIKKYKRYRRLGNSVPVCFAPFKSLYFGFEGKVTACCFNRSYVLGHIPESSVLQIWNSERADKLRQILKKDQLENGCMNCKEWICSGNYNAVGANFYDNYQERLDTPVMVEFELSNLCNLECIMCEGYYSSLIRERREKLPPFKMPYDDTFVSQFDEIIPHLELTKFMGGEPFLIDIYFKIWEKIIRKNPGCIIDVQTNGTILTNKVKDILDKGNFQIGISIDSLEKGTYEKIRKNARFEQVIRNIRFFSAYSKEKGNPMHISVCPMRINWKEIPALMEFSNELEAYVFFNLVWKPADLALWNLPAEKLLEIYDYLHSYSPRTSNMIEMQNEKSYNGLLTQLHYWYTKALPVNDTTDPNKKEEEITVIENRVLKRINRLIKKLKAGEHEETGTINCYRKDTINKMIEVFSNNPYYKRAMIELDKVPDEIILGLIRQNSPEELLQKFKNYFGELNAATKTDHEE
ncbi:MAG TPA: radical SAM protein [Paludibacter sp.]|nr:MAG: Cyclic pyranopterin monophosphate synthase [Bacteroidetes bacterium ADurb.Bin123]HOC87779.1 radical SAM protein [Prolixibacteraceae bacterium]HQB27895.1 radical SAM protein [Paludibacter sp.]